jgi:ubiquinone/menaquinone biosynthesis C-methylase UbiE
MSERDFASSWRDVDAPGEAQPFVDFLDYMNQRDFFKERKRRAIDLLQLEPGGRVLEVGCGTGEESRALGELVGPNGRVTAVDVSQAMVDVARRRSDGLNLPIEFQVGDAHRLDFPGGSFDGSCCLSTLEIVSDPRKVVSELIRVTRPGGRVVVTALDGETYVVSSPERALTRKIVNNFCDKVVNGWLGRELPGLCLELGLTGLSLFASPTWLTDFPLVRDHWLRSMADTARDAGVISAAEADGWLAGVEKTYQAGAFVFACTTIVVGGTVMRNA